MNNNLRSLYFVSPSFDFVFLGGLSCATYALLALLGKNEWAGSAAMLAVYLSWVVNWPHFSATVYRLFSAKENTAQYPITSFVVPFLVIGGVVGSLAQPEVIAPVFVKLFLIWSPYHFSGQSVGVTLVYARRAEVEIPQWARLALSAFVFSTFAYPTSRAEVGTQGASYYGISYPPIGIPSGVPKLFLGSMTLGGIVFLGFVAHWMFKNKKLFPPILLVPAASQFVWFIAGASLQTYYVFVPLFHSLQYLPFAWAMQLGTKLKTGQTPPSKQFLWKETGTWFGINLIGGAVLFWGLPEAVALFGIPLAFATGVLLAGVQIHHFFVDGVIWKLKNRTVVSPLLLSVRDFLSPGPVSAREAA